MKGGNILKTNIKLILMILVLTVLFTPIIQKSVVLAEELQTDDISDLDSLESAVLSDDFPSADEPAEEPLEKDLENDEEAEDVLVEKSSTNIREADDVLAEEPLSKEETCY